VVLVYNNVVIVVAQEALVTVLAVVGLAPLLENVTLAVAQVILIRTTNVIVAKGPE